MTCCWILAATFLFSTHDEYLMPYNTWVLAMDPLNYTSVDSSKDVFDVAIATQRLKKPKKWEAAEFYLHLTFCLTQYEFLLPYNTWVLVMDSLNHTSVDPSIEVFDVA